MKIEPELDPFFSIDTEYVHPETGELSWGFACRTCDAVWAYPKAEVRSMTEAEYHDDAETVLDKGSRNALLAHAKSHRAPRLRRIERRDPKSIRLAPGRRQEDEKEPSS